MTPPGLTFRQALALLWSMFCGWLLSRVVFR